MVGATIANEIRVIAAGLAGKKDVQLVQVKDLMIDTSVGRGSKSKRARNDDDRSGAESYYRAWAQSIKTKLKDVEADKSKGPISKSSPSRKRQPSSRRRP